jgi:ribose transport system substrate-binding protein
MPQSTSPLTRRAAAGLLLAGIACNRQSKRVIGVVPQGQSHIFWQSIHAGAVAAAQETGVEVLWNGPAQEADSSAEIKVVDSMINRRVDAIAVAPADKTALAGVIERAVKSGIPVIVFDTPVDTDVYTSQIATDNLGGGVMAAERLAKILGGQGKVVLLATRVGIASTMLREQGFEETIKKFPGIQIMDKRYGEANFATSLQVAENLLTAHPGLNGMFSSNESGTVGAVQALKGRKSNCKLVGFDWSPTLAEALQTGVADSLVVQDPFRIGYDSVKAAVEKLNGGTPPKIKNLPPTLVTKDNLKDPAIDKLLNPDLKKYLGS